MEKFFTYTRSTVAFVIVLCSFGFLFCIVFVPIPQGNKDTVNLVAGIVLAVLAGVTGYYFGSSKDKSDQDKAIQFKTP